jgi:hypothetical protein
MKFYVFIVILLINANMRAQLCNVGCLLRQGPQYEYGNVIFGDWNPERCCI